METLGVAIKFWRAAKVFRLDAGLSILTLIVIVYWALGNTIWAEGAMAILFVYAFGNTIRCYGMRTYTDYLKGILNDNKIPYQNEDGTTANVR